jgi:PAS domain S-box-containing protein
MSLADALEAALWAGPIGVAVLDRELRFLRVNPALAAVNGLPAEAHVGRTVPELFGHEGSPFVEVARRVNDVARAVLESGRPRVNVAMRGVRPGGSVREWLAAYLPIPGADARAEGVLALVTDVTEERERTRSLLRERAETERSARRLAVVQGITAALSAARDPAEVALVAAERLRDAVGASVGVIRRVVNGMLELVEHHGCPSPVLPEWTRMPTNAPSPAAVAVRTGTPVWISSAAELAEKYPSIAGAAFGHGRRGWAAVPLRARGEVMGALTLMFDEERRFDLEERAFVLGLADLCAQALDRAFGLEAERATREAAQRARERLALLQGVTSALSQARTAGDVAQVLVELGSEALGACSAVVFARDRDGLALLAARGRAEEVREKLAHLAPDAPLPPAHVVRSGQPLWLESAEEIDAAFPSLAALITPPDRFGAVAAAPLEAAGSVIGSTAFGFPAARVFSPEDRGFVVALAGQCALALERAQRFDLERAARADAEQARALLNALFENAPVGIGFLDRDLRFVRVNPALAEMHGVPADAHLGRRTGEILPGIATEEIEAAFRDVLRTGAPLLDVEVAGETPAAPGRRRIWLESWYPVRAGGRVAGIGALVREVTREREAQEFQRNVLGIVGHDLRNPLSAISTSAQLLRRAAGEDTPTGRLSDRILGNAERMTRIISVLADYARLRGGQGIPVRRFPCDLADLCRAVADEAEAARPGRTVNVVAEGDTRGAWDADRVAQVLANLIGNAVDYSAPGSAVEVLCRGEDDLVTVRVVNQGAAIPAEILPNIFEPFRRGERQREGGKDGLGLGLFIARAITVAHGGRIEVESAGGTTVFEVRFPRGG